jgi:hypothetical protein
MFALKAGSAKSDAHVQEALETMGIAPMSRVYDHDPMWAHYAGDFTGMCVECSFKQLLKGLGEDVKNCRTMYSEREPVLFNDRKTRLIERA